VKVICAGMAEQNVRGFRDAERNVADELGITLKLAGAMAVGRFRDGTPVAVQAADGTRPITNDFNYDCDPAAQKCPLHAHIRKTNPRLGSVKFGGPFAQSIEEELGHRIARRSTSNVEEANLDIGRGRPAGVRLYCSANRSPPNSQRTPMYTLGQAAKATGKAKSSISAAIKDGTIWRA
jgi:deferrochelatase/peroxidase EfeB